MLEHNCVPPSEWIVNTNF